MRAILVNIESTGIDYEKLFEKIDYCLENRYYFSKRGVQSTYYLLYQEVKQAYLDNYIETELFPDEYLPICQVYRAGNMEIFNDLN